MVAVGVKITPFSGTVLRIPRATSVKSVFAHSECGRVLVYQRQIFS